MKRIGTQMGLLMLCLLLLFSPTMAETRQGVIVLEGMEEPVQETLFDCDQGFSFWYVKDRLEAYEGSAHGIEGVVIAGLYSDDYMVLSVIPEEDAVEYGEELNMDILEQSSAARVQRDVYRELENGKYLFLTLIAENGDYLSAVGEYAQESAEGNAHFFDRVLNSLMFNGFYDTEMLKQLPGKWFAEEDGAGTELTLEENGNMILSCHKADGGAAYTCKGTWSAELIRDCGSKITLLFTSTDHPLYAGKEYRVECVYQAYTESWMENDTLKTYLIMESSAGSSGLSPFEEVYGYDGAALHREQGPNMQVVKCSSFVSLREAHSKSSKRLARVPLGALVYAFLEEGEENGFIHCTYQDADGYILAEYLKPVKP